MVKRIGVKEFRDNLAASLEYVNTIEPIIIEKNGEPVATIQPAKGLHGSAEITSAQRDNLQSVMDEASKEIPVDGGELWDSIERRKATYLKEKGKLN